MSFLFLEILISLALVLSLGVLTLDQAIALKIMAYQSFQHWSFNLSMQAMQAMQNFKS